MTPPHPSIARNSITISWPAQVLRPNVSAHGARKGAARKRQRLEAWALAKEAKLLRPGAPCDPIRVRIEAFPKEERRRDKDNLIGSLKGALDGLAQAIGVDDSLFDPVAQIHPADGTGRIVLTVEAM